MVKVNRSVSLTGVNGEARPVNRAPGVTSAGPGARVLVLDNHDDFAEARRDIARLYDDGANPDYMPGLSDADKKERLARISYRDFLLDLAKVHPDVIPFFDDRPKGLFCVGIDAYPALYGWAEGYPGFQGMNLEPFSRVGPLTHIGGGQHGRENELDGGPTIDLPDGNATVARLLVRAMIPDALPGTSLEDSIMSRLAYDRIDREGSDARSDSTARWSPSGTWAIPTQPARSRSPTCAEAGPRRYGRITV